MRHPSGRMLHDPVVDIHRLSSHCQGKCWRWNRFICQFQSRSNQPLFINLFIYLFEIVVDFFFWAFFRENLWKFGNFQRGMFSLISIDYWKTIDDNSDVSDAGTSANSSSSSSPSSPSSSTSPSSSSALVAIDYPVNYRSSSPDGPDQLWMSHRVGIRHDSHVHFLFVCLFFHFIIGTDPHRRIHPNFGWIHRSVTNGPIGSPMRNPIGGISLSTQSIIDGDAPSRSITAHRLTPHRWIKTNHRSPAAKLKYYWRQQGFTWLHSNQFQRLDNSLWIHMSLPPDNSIRLL